MSMYAEERQEAMAQVISRSGRRAVAELASSFGVTTETVRRDLGVLERAGLIRRVHGGAIPAASLAFIESGLTERDSANTVQKDAIAAVAVQLLPPPDSIIIIDAGSTTGRFAARLPRDHPMSVVTHAVPIAARLAGLPHLAVDMLPGRVRTATQAAVGAATVEAIGHLRVDAVFVGTNGFTPDAGLTTPDVDEAAVKRAIVAAARRVIVLADSTKLGVEAPRVFCPASHVDVLVTDEGIEQEQRAAFEDVGVEVIVA